ncbi:MAG: ribosome small subunit-dependent GTPase A [Planctomycetota bacterium]
MAKKKRKLRANFRKNTNSRTRANDLTRRFGTDEAGDADEAGAPDERVSGKGRLTRRRTVAGGEVVEDATGEVILPEVDTSVCLEGRVLRVQGLVSRVEASDSQVYRCATRQVLKQLSTGLRHVVAAGDHVWIRPEAALGAPSGEPRRGKHAEREGIIERVEPRYGALSRTSRGRQQVIAANIDQVLIVASAAEPRIKPNLIDRYLITCERTGIRPIIGVNKVDLIEPADLMPLVGVYAQLGYEVVLLSTVTGAGVDRLRAMLAGKQTALAGQSGVGKSSLLNAIHPGLGLRVNAVSAESQKGRHTTTTAEVFPFGGASGGRGFVVDTPGIRQFALWDVIPEEVPAYFRELRPYVSQCRFPDCTHTHEDPCAVKDAVADGWIDTRRYESYLQIQAGDEA